MSFDAELSKILASWEVLYLFKFKISLLVVAIVDFKKFNITSSRWGWRWRWCEYDDGELSLCVIWWWSPCNGCQMQGNLATYRQQSLSNAPSKAPCLFRLFPLCKYYFCIEWIFEQIWTFNNNMEFNFCGPPRGQTIWFHNKSQLSTSSSSSPSSATL